MVKVGCRQRKGAGWLRGGAHPSTSCSAVKAGPSGRTRRRSSQPRSEPSSASQAQNNNNLSGRSGAVWPGVAGARPGYDRGRSPPWLLAGVTSDLPRWHTQRNGRCPNSREPHGERRLQPERRPRRPARRTSCTYLRHRRPTNSPQRVPPVLLDIHQIFTTAMAHRHKYSFWAMAASTDLAFLLVVVSLRHH